MGFANRYVWDLEAKVKRLEGENEKLQGRVEHLLLGPSWGEVTLLRAEVKRLEGERDTARSEVWAFKGRVDDHYREVKRLEGELAQERLYHAGTLNDRARLREEVREYRTLIDEENPWTDLDFRAREPKVQELIAAAREWKDGGRGTRWFEHGVDPSGSRLFHGPGKKCDCEGPNQRLRKALEPFEKEENE